MTGESDYGTPEDGELQEQEPQNQSGELTITLRRGATMLWLP